VRAKETRIKKQRERGKGGGGERATEREEIV
jgi:hypothetical protein